jgi:Ca2+-binding EF-hand superfamily protein
MMGWRGGRSFDRYDVNGDGVIDANEIAQHQQKAVAEGVKRMTARLNLGADGKLTKEAFLAKAKARFADLDLNGDGRITDADLPPMMRGRGILK